MLTEMERMNHLNVSMNTSVQQKVPPSASRLWKKIGHSSGKKVNKVRFVPSKTRHDNDVGLFVTATYQEDENELSLWTVDPMARFEQNEQGCVQKISPTGTLKCKFDCMDLKVSDGGRVFVCWKNGSFGMYTMYPSLELNYTWENLHQIPRQIFCACRGVDFMGEDVVTIGDDGKLILLNSYSAHQQPVRIIEASSGALSSVCFIKHNEVLCGNSRGQISCWDLRKPAAQPGNTLCLSRLRGEKTVHPVANSLAKHPTRTHLLLSGGSDGCVSLWDLRNTKFPVEFNQIHSGPVLEAHFHPEMQEHIASCSASGEAFLWDCSLPLNPLALNSSSVLEQDAWSSVGRAYAPQVSNLMPKIPAMAVTSLALSHNMIVCSKDPGFVSVFKKSFK
ncbi:nucleoporin Nup43 [Neocloeon triangulifer]|uniref:nucleoporin Nup43 n=1 Tax=Neocloeon triangulifer TaxID=2078957 RepID=UPI00286F91AF|nr:nucleoporin Nup43 [Neocloeon triangulifer]